jgi:hypothetical protein
MLRVENDKAKNGGKSQTWIEHDFSHDFSHVNVAVLVTWCFNLFQSVPISFNPQIVRIIQNGLLWVDNFGPKVFVHLSRAETEVPPSKAGPRSQLQQVFHWHQLLLDLAEDFEQKKTVG